MIDTILIVDDEDGVRRTFQEWLSGSDLPVKVLAVSDAESALKIVNGEPIDLAILDWNLGSGSDGLQLLEDLVEFQPEIVAILVTGYANQATPLDALRMGVRDYIDKNQDLNRESFLKAVRKQLDRISPAKRQRAWNQSLAAFRESVEKVLPLVRGSATLNDPVPLPNAIHALFRFLLRTTGAPTGALIVRQMPDQGPEVLAAYDPEGKPLPMGAVSFPQSLAATVVSLQEPCVMNDFDPLSLGLVQLFPFEQNRKSLLAMPVPVGTGVHVILELYDKPLFTAEDRQLILISSDIAAELLRQALAQRQTQRLLFDAIESALKASETVSFNKPTDAEEELPPAVLDKLRKGMAHDTSATIDPETGLKLIEAVRELAQRHGNPAVKHCVQLVESLRKLLDEIQGS